MNRRSLAALVLINAVLLASLAVVVLTPPAAAQPIGGSSNFLMISGQIRGRSNQNVVYILDQQSSRMLAMVFNSSTNRFEYIATRRVADDAQTAPAGDAR